MFLFPLKNISFRADDLLEDKLLEPLNSGHLMIAPRINNMAKELCEQLIGIYAAKIDGNIAFIDMAENRL